MAKYIDAEHLPADRFFEGMSYKEKAKVIQWLIQAPSADVAVVKHGRWEMRRAIVFDDELVGYRCSECNTTWDTDTRYCPYCGAKMDVKAKDEEGTP